MSTMLDLPEIFWDNERLEKLYYLAWEYFDLDDRIGIVNKRLGLIKEIFDILNGDHMNRQMTKMKIIVIFLLLLLTLLMFIKVLK